MALICWRGLLVPVAAGSKAPMPVWPLPVQSPTTGTQPGAPNWKAPASGAPAEFSLRRYQVAVAGSKTPAVAVPLPSQSPTTGTQPGAPYRKTPASALPPVSELRRNHWPVDGSKTPGLWADDASRLSVPPGPPGAVTGASDPAGVALATCQPMSCSPAQSSRVKSLRCPGIIVGVMVAS